MKEIDDTTPPETETELTADEIQRAIRFILKQLGTIERWIDSQIVSSNRLENRVANLEVRRVANEYNMDDSEWY